MSNLRYTNLPSDPANEDVLTQIALDADCSMDRTADKLWQELNPELWAETHNAWTVLQTVSGPDLKRITAQPAFRATLDEIVQGRATDKDSPRWFQRTHSKTPLSCI